MANKFEKACGETHVGAHNLQHTAVNVLVRDALDVAISNFLVPNLQRFGTVRAISSTNVGVRR